MIMALIILSVLALGAMMPNYFSPKMRYTAWIIILIGLVIPFRPMLGNGLITLQFPNTPTAQSQNRTNGINSALIEPPTIGEIEQATPAYGSALQNDSILGQTISIAHVLVMVLGVVAFAIFAYHIWRYISFNKIIKRWSINIKDERILSVLQAVQLDKGIAHKTIGLKKCDFISTSMIVGFLRPTILLPDKNFDTDELELIFRHELIHYKRGDLYVKLLSVIAISINWFNPSVYLMSASMQADCEASCDEAVITDVGGESKQFYAETIMDMIGSKKSNVTMLSTCFYGSKKGIRKRMEAIMNAPSRGKKIAFSVLASLVMLIALSGSLFAFSGQAPDSFPEQHEHQNPITDYQPADNAEQNNIGQITSQQAREIALDFVGYGTVHDIVAFINDDELVFEVDVRYGAMRYAVLIKAENGNILSLTSHEIEESAIEQTIPEGENSGMASESDLYAPPDSIAVLPIEPTPQPTPQETPYNPNSHNNAHGNNSGQSNQHGNNVGQGNQHGNNAGHGSGQGNRPSDPAISLERAIEIANADLISRGVNATYRSNSGMSWERGQWVWELLYRTQGERMPFIEFYINVDNGNIVKFEWDD
jgi:beta-lactamase regulating signal transducer with metallopeptidase domain/uncharacterized membrane protein YkoI